MDSIFPLAGPPCRLCHFSPLDNNTRGRSGRRNSVFKSSGLFADETQSPRKSQRLTLGGDRMNAAGGHSLWGISISLMNGGKVVICLKRVEFFSTHSAGIIKLQAFFFYFYLRSRVISTAKKGRGWGLGGKGVSCVCKCTRCNPWQQGGGGETLHISPRHPREKIRQLQMATLCLARCHVSLIDQPTAAAVGTSAHVKCSPAPLNAPLQVHLQSCEGPRRRS